MRKVLCVGVTISSNFGLWKLGQSLFAVICTARLVCTARSCVVQNFDFPNGIFVQDFRYKTGCLKGIAYELLLKRKDTADCLCWYNRMPWKRHSRVLQEGCNWSGREGATEGEGEGEGERERERDEEVQQEGGNASGYEGATEVEGELQQRITRSSLRRAGQEQPTDHEGTACVGAKHKGARGAVFPATAAKKQHTGKEQQATGKDQRKRPREETELDPEEDIPLAQRQKRNILSSAEGEDARAREVAAGGALLTLPAVLRYVFRGAFEGCLLYTSDAADDM
eukprot:2454366-Rhodomonas_salina.1